MRKRMYGACFEIHHNYLHHHLSRPAAHSLISSRNRQKVNLSMYRAKYSLRVPGGCDFRNFSTIGTWSWQGCQPYAPGALFLLRGWVDPMAIVQSEGLSQWKIPMTPSEAEPATFRLVVQSLKQLRHRLLLVLQVHDQFVQGGSNMTGTDLCVNKPHCAAAVRPWQSEATTSILPPARVRTCSVLSGSC